MELTIIKKYFDEFHDGALFGIERQGQDYILSLESAEMEHSDMKDQLMLSKRGTIKGKLHIKNIDSIFMNDVLFSGKLKMLHDRGSIFDFILEDMKIELQISWVNFPPHQEVNEFSVIIIHAQKIWWENIPDLFDPSW